MVTQCIRDKLQIVQNTALRIATGCTHDTNTQHLHDETNVLPIHQHLQLHASQIRQKAQHPTHPLHKMTIHPHTPRLKEQTTFNNINYTTNIDTHPYIHKVDETHHPSSFFPLCKTHPYTTDHTPIYLKQHTGPLDVSRESGASASQVEDTSGRAALE